MIQVDMEMPENCNSCGHWSFNREVQRVRESRR